MAASLRISLLSAIVLAGSPAVVAAAQERPYALEYLCEDIPPSNYLREGRLTGISVDLLRSMWSAMDEPHQTIKVVPWAHGYDAVLNRPGNVLFSMSRTRERDSLFKWVGPIFMVRNVLLAR